MLNFSSDEFYSTDSVVLFIDFFKEFFLPEYLKPRLDYS